MSYPKLTLQGFSILTRVLGPEFHGPSSSHTAGPEKLALLFHRAALLARSRS